MDSLTRRAPDGRGVIEWGAAGRALAGQSGDLHLVVPFSGGALVALIDGLGHGAAAADAALTAAPVLEAHASESVLSLIERCHERLRTTRGAVMSLASFSVHHASMTWIGVGNVGGILLRSGHTPERRDEALAARGGVVGFQLPPLRARSVTVCSGDTLIMTTDGIRDAFTTGTLFEQSPQEIAESILARFARPFDDAHVLVARYVGALA
jgi:phosphoserine phosphatase RsbX